MAEDASGTGVGSYQRGRRRADARRSIDAILNAARVVLGERPEASTEDIAATAGVTRQTVYAHFPSRDAVVAALVAALVEVAAAEYAALLDEADLDAAPPAEAPARFLAAGRRFLDRYPLLVNATANRIPRPDSDPHDVVPPRLERLIRRGRQTGDLDPSPPAAWLAAAILGLQPPPWRRSRPGGSRATRRRHCAWRAPCGCAAGRGRRTRAQDGGVGPERRQRSISLSIDS